MVPRYVILVDGQFTVYRAKTGLGVMRYCPDQVVAVLDRDHAGRSVHEVVGLNHPAPIVGSLREALPHEPNRVLIGIAPTGGGLPAEWRPWLIEALELGMDIVSGLHLFLVDDPELGPLAASLGRRLIDLRRPPDERSVANLRARATRAKRVLFVGTDCSIGKMTAALELAAAARADGLDARFAATGQTGMAIADSGIPLDAIVGDFMAGAVEDLVLAHGDGEVVFVEGQGSLLHPGYAPVTLALMHGAAPDAMVLCHDATRPKLRGADVTIPPLSEVIALHETVMAPVHPCKVAGINLMTLGLDDEAARQAVAEVEAETGLPATDVVRFGCEPLAGLWREMG